MCVYMCGGGMGKADVSFQVVSLLNISSFKSMMDAKSFNQMFCNDFLKTTNITTSCDRLVTGGQIEDFNIFWHLMSIKHKT